MRRSVEEAINAARNALEDSKQQAEEARAYAERIAQRADEANQIIADYWR